MWGPKKAAQFTPSRSIATTIDVPMDAEDVSLLQYAYSNEYFRSEYTAGVLSRTFAFIYGTSISSESLRHAVLAHAAYSRLESCSVDKHISRVRQHLIRKRYSSLNEGDLFAVYLLGMLSALRGKPEEFVCHLRGFLSIMKVLRSNDAPAELSMFWPLARRQFVMCGSWLSDESMMWFWQESQQVIGSPTITQTGKYCRFWAMETGNPDRAPCWSLIDSLCQIYTILRRCLRAAAERQSKNCSGLDANVVPLLSDLKDLLYSDIQGEVIKYESRVKAEIRNGTSDRSTDAYEITLMYRIICFLVVLLEAPSILASLKLSVKSALEITSLLRYFYPWYVAPTQDWLYHQILSISWLAGLAFSWEEFPESKRSRIGHCANDESFEMDCGNSRGKRRELSHGGRTEEILGFQDSTDSF